MSYFTVKLTKASYLGWYWRVEKDGYEVFDYSFTKVGAKRAAAKVIGKWHQETITEMYTVKAK